MTPSTSPPPLNGKDTAIESDNPSDEKTEVWYGIEYTINRTLQTLSQVKHRFDNCGDVRHSSIIVTTEPVKKAFIDVKNRGVKTRFITEITKGNLHYCKELMQVISEVRHLDGIKGNFAVGESFYAGYAIGQEAKPLAHVIYSTAQEFVEQQKFFFDMLWSKAIPAEQRIKEIEEGIEPEKTEVLYGAENIIDNTRQYFDKIRERLDSVFDSSGPSILVKVNQIRDAAIKLKERGGKIRLITEITKENIDFCKELMKTDEIRHLDGIKGHFAIADGKEYRGSARPQLGQPLITMVSSNVREFVEQQQYFFETLWNKAIPTKQRIKEIEKGAKREFVETIREPHEIQELSFDVIKAAENEILILFSTANVFRRQQKAGALELLREAVNLHGVKVRILVPIGDNDNNSKGISERIQHMKDAGIDIRTIKQTLQNKLTMLIVDQASCLIVELKDDSKEETSDESIGLATYSNSEATVFSYLSIFENLWIKTELHKR